MIIDGCRRCNWLFEKCGYDLSFMKTADHNKKYNSEHLVNQCKRDTFEFGENELVKMYLDRNIFYSYALSRFDSKFGVPYFECLLKEALGIFKLQSR